MKTLMITTAGLLLSLPATTALADRLPVLSDAAICSNPLAVRELQEAKAQGDKAWAASIEECREVPYGLTATVIARFGPVLEEVLEVYLHLPGGGRPLRGYMSRSDVFIPLDGAPCEENATCVTFLKRGAEYQAAAKAKEAK